MLTWDTDLTLLGAATYHDDEYGNQIAVPAEQVVQAAEQQISRQEFYQAAQAGIRPARMFVVHPFEYHGEDRVRVDGNTYSVIRTFQRSDDELELYVEQKVADRDG